MIDKIVAKYQKLEMAIISQFAGNTDDIVMEAGFYSNGFMQTQISRVQKEFNQVSMELKTLIELKDKSEYAVQKKRELAYQREYLIQQMIFLLSNRIENIEKCEQLLKEHPNEFGKCIEALAEYKVGNNKKAFEILEQYYTEHNAVENHFLINKVFGMLLLENGKVSKAIPFLSYAISLVPDDVQTLQELSRAYKRENNIVRKKIVDDVLMVVS